VSADPAVVEVLVRSHRQFHAFLARRLGDPATAEDVLQSAYVKGLERADEIRDREGAVAWFYRLLRNAVVDVYRRRDAERRALEQRAGTTSLDEQPEPEVERAICQCVGALLPTLKPEYGDLLRRIDLDGESIAGAAAGLGLTPNNVRVRLHRARQALRRQLQRSCGTCTEHGCLDCSCRAGGGA